MPGGQWKEKLFIVLVTTRACNPAVFHVVTESLLRTVNRQFG